MSFLISCWGMVNFETNAAHWLPTIVHPKSSNAVQEFLCYVLVVFREKNSIYWLETKACKKEKKKKRTVTAKENISIGTWVVKK